MAYIGMLALGAFIGGLLIIGLDFMRSRNEFQKILFTVLGAAFSGVVMEFVRWVARTADSDVRRGISAYPLGLLLALLWWYAAGNAIPNIKGANRFLGWLHLIGVVIITVVVTTLVLPPAYRETWTHLKK
jgi:hypothetical protein